MFFEKHKSEPNSVSETKRKTRQSADLSGWLEKNIQQGADAPFSEVVLLTPALAQECLNRNKSNRPVAKNHVVGLSNAIKRGEWQLTHQGLAFDVNGNLIDGQHRAYAVVDAGISITTMISFGVSADAFEVLDYGRKRSISDVLALTGEQNTNNLAAAIRYCWNYDGKRSPYTMTPSPAQSLDYLNENPGLRDSASPAALVYREFRGSLSMLMAVHYIFARLDGEMADTFFYLVATGDGIKTGEPESILRSRLIANLSGKNRMTRVEFGAVFIKSWNLRRTGQRRRQLVWRADEAFPEAI